MYVNSATISDEFVEASQDQLKLAFIAAVVLSLVVPRLPFGRQILYPFALLSTWVHELGHGIAAIIAGGQFNRLEVYSNLGGTAFSSGVQSGMRRAFVSAGGLVGPAVVGGIIIIAGSREETAQYVLAAVAGSVLLSAVLVLRNQFGFVAMTAIGLLLGLVAWKAPVLAKLFVAQLIGIQFCLACWGTLDYMFTKDFVRDGYVINSDTQNIAEELVLPYWFWAACVALISAIILIGSFYFAWLRPELTPYTP